ncbi:hypothetical protein MVES1_001765 [Malassezia vespertilionis]|uniref:Mim1p n=1 Tax=Malassezia vespertilionis TaxID=2020962 RepID=A0A2N1JD39_9BASI|nr:uncharacterized protein MVES1_001765 [Malassezia vespertilionis]PKI84449.1 hypothetical protein MVES_001664 [Malassezia vespertilionis]WFD06420.1 hypothetical protein MVES1_001765 [Malassezia vespertilionis]
MGPTAIAPDLVQGLVRETLDADLSEQLDDATDKETAFMDDLDTDSDTSTEQREVLIPAPTGELTLQAFWASNIPWHRRLILISASIAINIGLPFINGVFLGFGEIFARAFLAPWLGLAPPLLNFNPFSPSPADVPPLSSIPPGGLRSWAKGAKEKAADAQASVAEL